MKQFFKNKNLRTFIKIIVILLLTVLSYYLNTLINNKYERSIPEVFWAIIFVFFLVALTIEKNRNKYIVSNSLVLIYIVSQVLVLLIPKLHEFLCNFFAWSL